MYPSSGRRRQLRRMSRSYLRLLRWRIAVVVEQDAPGRCFQVIELATAYRPEERRHRCTKQQQAERNQHVDDAQDRASLSFSTWPGVFATGCGIRPRRSALKVTKSELADMPSAASQGASTPATASGTAIAL